MPDRTKPSLAALKRKKRQARAARRQGIGHDRRLTTFLRNVPRLFYDRRFYADLLCHQAGLGLAFIVLQVFLGYIGPLALKAPMLSQFEERATAFLARMPEISVHKGLLATDLLEPYTVRFDMNDQASFALMFNLPYKPYNLVDLADYMQNHGLQALATQHFLAIAQPGKPVDLHSYPIERKITRQDWVWLGNAAVPFAPVLLVALAIPVFLAFFCVVVLKAVALLALSLFFPLQLSFSGAMRLAAAASVPALAVNFLLAFASTVSNAPTFQLPVLASLLIWLGFSLFALRAASPAFRPKPSFQQRPPRKR